MKETKLLFIYSLLAVLFLFISSSMSVKSYGDIVYVALIVPVLIYLVFVLFSVIDTPQVHIRKRHVFPALLLAGVMTMLAVFRIQNIPNEQPEPSSSPITIHIEDPVSEITSDLPAQITIVAPNGPVNIRSNPSISSEIIGQANDGELFDFSVAENDWYKVNLQSGEEGYIYKNFVKEQ